MKLEQVRALALALPDAVEAPHFDYTSFRVGGKIFATAPPAGTHLHLFVGEELRAPLLALHPDTYEALPWGRKIVGLRVRLAGAQRTTIERLLREAWKAKAPKRLLAALRE